MSLAVPMPHPLGTAPSQPESADGESQLDRVLGLKVSLDRPFHELKQVLLAEFERAYIARCLEDTGMNMARASRWSGLSRKHIRTLMSKHGMIVRRELQIDGLDRDRG